jgi:hypothetical protein
MADTLSIAIACDISGLETAMEAAADSVNRSANGFADEFQRAGQATDDLARSAEQAAPAIARVSAAQKALLNAIPEDRTARDTADKIAQIQEQATQKHIQSEERANAALLQMGQETIAQAEAQAIKLENTRYDVELDFLRRKEEIDKADASKLKEDQAREQALTQEHTDRVLAIETEYSEKKQKLSAQALQDTIRDLDFQLKLRIAAANEAFAQGKIDAAQKVALEREADNDIISQEIALLQVRRSLYTEGSAEYAKYTQEIKALQDKLAGDISASTTQLAELNARAWQNADREILSSEDSLIQKLLTKRQSLKVDLEQMALQLAEKELEADARLWTEKALIALLGEGKIKATQQGGLLAQLLFNRQELAATVQTQGEKNAAVTAGTSTQNAIQSAGNMQGLAQSISVGTAQVSNNAMVGASGAMSAVASIPYIGPFLAMAAGPAMEAAIMAYSALTSLDVGAWELPGDMPAMLHKGEMVVPQNFAAGLRAHGGVGDGGDTVFNNHYYPTINMRDPTSLKQLLQGTGAELAHTIARGYRTGMPMRPSSRTL